MDIVSIVNELKKELERIDALILALDQLHTGRRRGRPPKLLTELRAGAKPGTVETKSRRTAAKRAAAKKTAAKKAKKAAKKAAPKPKA
jgi:hypothetical protein